MKHPIRTPLLLLAGINLLAHFIPFERLCLSLDSLARWTLLLVHGPSIAWTKLTTVTTRPSCQPLRSRLTAMS